MSKRKISAVTVIVLAIVLVSARVWFHFVPRGAAFLPYVMASSDPTVIVSPDRKHRVTVVFNDAGAAHSGNHWTWVIADNWLLGKRVLAQGYSSPDVRYGDSPLPIAWQENGRFSILFLDGRYSGEPRRVQGSL